MTLNPGREPRADTRDIHQPKETHKKGAYLLGTDFRHAVEFSRSGRAETRPSRASSLAACPTVRRLRSPAPGGALRGPPGPRPAHGEPYTTLGDGAQVGGGRPASHGADRSQRPRKVSIPTVSPGRLLISRTARSTP